VTRAADFANITNLSPWYNEAAYTFFGQALSANAAPANQVVASFSNGDFNNRNQIVRGYLGPGNTKTLAGITLAGATVASFSGVDWPSNTVVKAAESYTAGQQFFASNGILSAGPTTGTFITATQFTIGARVDGALQFNGWIQRITVYPSVLSTTQLQSITA
jgi:hypothetical protein